MAARALSRTQSEKNKRLRHAPGKEDYMKKFNSTLALIVALLVAFVFPACSGSKLDTPVGFSIDENNVLSWEEVEGARSYTVSIRDLQTETESEASTRKTSYTLSDLAEGDYEIKVMAMGGSQNSLRSEWSDIQNFHKDYETGLIYTLINGDTEYAISQSGTAQGTVRIEDVYRGKPVTAILEAAFRASGRIENLIVGANVRTVGANAFYQCPRLASVELPDSVVSIGESAFQGCSSLTSVRLPAHLQAIAPTTFAYCRGLKGITFGEELRSIGDTAFYSCTGITSLEFPDSLQSIGTDAFSASPSSEDALTSVSFGSGLLSIGENAFSNRLNLSQVIFAGTNGLSIGTRAFNGCRSLEEAVLAEGLASIGNYAFSGCEALADVALPESVSAIGRDAFLGTELYRKQADSNTYGGFIYAGDWLVGATAESKSVSDFTIASFKENTVGIASRVFQSCPELGTVRLPVSLKYVGTYAFADSPKLRSLITAEGSALEEIGDYAFYNCGTLSNIVFQRRGLKRIGNGAFANCLSVSNNRENAYLLVPETVESIGQRAYYGTALWNEPTEEGIIYAGNWVVGYANITQSEVALSENVEGIADAAFANCEIITGVQNLNRVRYIGEAAFSGCTALTSVSLSRNLQSIGAQTFFGCSSLISLGTSLPRSLEEVGVLAFAGCSALTSLDFSVTALTTLDVGAFWGCSSLNELIFGDDLETIGAYAFCQCVAVTSVKLPASVIYVGERAFSNCDSLAELDLGSTEFIGPLAFSKCISLKELTLPATVKEVGDFAFFCAGIEKINFSEGLKRIGACAFYRLEGLSSLSLPASLEYIGENAFRDCVRLGSVIMCGEIGYIGPHAFYKCFNMTVYSAAPMTASAAWDGLWNSSFRPVFWECKLDDGGNVLSVTAGQVSNPYARFGAVAPHRDGFEFAGWATSEDGEAVYDAQSWRDAAEGTMLYAIYTGNPENQ